MECTWSEVSPRGTTPSHYHPLTSSLLTSWHYIGSHSCDHFSLSNLVNRSFRLPLHLSLSSLLSYHTSSSPFLFAPASTPSHPLPSIASLLPLPPSFLAPSPSSLPLLSLPHTAHRKVMPRLSVLKWDNWTCWRQDQQRTAPSRLSR